MNDVLDAVVNESQKSKDVKDEIANTVLRDKHVKFFKHVINLLPEMYQNIDSSRLTVLYFSLSALDLLDALDELDEGQKESIIKWIYSLQVNPASDESIGTTRCGFYATDSLPHSAEDNFGHIAMTYVALCSLLMIGDDLSGINRDQVICGLKALQLKNGSFQCIAFGSESDARFVYCASCISYMLKDWRGMDIDKASKFLMLSQSYEGGFAQNIGREAHGGSTYCSIAALHLMGKLDCIPHDNRKRLLSWCIQRQSSGFNGRPNKPVDTCYSFWVGASLAILDAKEFINKECNFSFLMTTQDRYMGGFSKWAGHLPDVLHSYFGLAGLYLISGEKEIHPALNISMRAYRHLQSLS